MRCTTQTEDVRVYLDLVVLDRVADNCRNEEERIIMECHFTNLLPVIAN